MKTIEENPIAPNFKTWTANMLKPFCRRDPLDQEPAKKWLCSPFLIHVGRHGDGTETHARKMRSIIGEEGYQHYPYDSAASDGRIIVLLTKCRLPELVEAPIGWGKMLWPVWDADELVVRYDNEIAAGLECGDEAPRWAEDPTSRMILGRVIAGLYIEKIATLPNAVFCGPHDKETEPLVFRFTGGAGCVMPLRQVIQTKP